MSERGSYFLGGALVVSLLIQLLASSLGLGPGYVPDLLLILIAASATRMQPQRLLVVAWLAGLAEGAFVALPVGATATAKVLTAYAIVRALKLVDLGDRRILLLAVLGASLLNACLLALVPLLPWASTAFVPVAALTRALITTAVALLLLEPIEQRLSGLRSRAVLR